MIRHYDVMCDVTCRSSSLFGAVFLSRACTAASRTAASAEVSFEEEEEEEAAVAEEEEEEAAESDWRVVMSSFAASS